MKQTKQYFEFDYEAVKNKALAQLKSGKPLLGKEGALDPLFKSFLKAALEAELDNHLQENNEEDSNRQWSWEQTVTNQRRHYGTDYSA